MFIILSWECGDVVEWRKVLEGMNGWMDEWMDGWMNEWMDGWMNK